MNALYTSQAELYARLADDRDFEAECALFLGSWQALQVAAPRTDWNLGRPDSYDEFAEYTDRSA